MERAPAAPVTIEIHAFFFVSKPRRTANRQNAERRIAAQGGHP